MSKYTRLSFHASQKLYAQLEADKEKIRIGKFKLSAYYRSEVEEQYNISEQTLRNFCRVNFPWPYVPVKKEKPVPNEKTPTDRNKQVLEFMNTVDELKAIVRRQGRIIAHFSDKMNIDISEID